MNKTLITILLSIITFLPAFSQNRFGKNDSEKTPISWSASAKMISETEGIVRITANISDGWHLYGLTMPADGPKPTRIKFITNSECSLEGSLIADRSAKEKFDSMFSTNVEYWEGRIIFKQRFKISSKNIVPEKIKCIISYMGCNDITCLPPSEITLDIRILPQKKL